MGHLKVVMVPLFYLVLMGCCQSKSCSSIVCIPMFFLHTAVALLFHDVIGTKKQPV